MEQSYLTTEFQKTVRDDFPAQLESLNAAFSSRLAQAASGKCRCVLTKTAAPGKSDSAENHRL